tara:strand:+ start:207 stop:626 length:420 start_codon:yes stop_codon:yes gene_type:complete
MKKTELRKLIREIISEETIKEYDFELEDQWDNLSNSEKRQILIDLDVDPNQNDYKDFDQFLKELGETFENAIKSKSGKENDTDKISKDGEKLKKLIISIVDKKTEWEDVFKILLNHAPEVSGLTTSSIKTLFQNKIKEF